LDLNISSVDVSRYVSRGPVTGAQPLPLTVRSLLKKIYATFDRKLRRKTEM